MSWRTSLKSLILRETRTPSLRERAAELRGSLAGLARRGESEAGQTRRTVVAGTLASAVPLPVIAAVSLTPAEQQHPDAELIAAGQRYERALAVEASTGAAFDEAWEPMRALLVTCPTELIARWPDRRAILGGMCWPTRVGGFLRPLPPDDDGACREAWTGEVLRNAIRLAVPRMGRGGQTPNRIRRWKALLPLADAFDADVRAADAVTDYRALAKAYRAAQDEVREAAHGLRDFTATTPVGLAFVVRLAALDRARGCNSSPNLLDSAANIAGVDLLTVATPRPGTFC